MKISNKAPKDGDIPKDKKNIPDDERDDQIDPEEPDLNSDDEVDEFGIPLDDDIKDFDEFDDEDDDDDHDDDNY